MHVDRSIYIYLFVLPSVCLSIYVSVCLPISIYLYLYIRVDPCIHDDDTFTPTKHLTPPRFHFDVIPEICIDTGLTLTAQPGRHVQGLRFWRQDALLRAVRGELSYIGLTRGRGRTGADARNSVETVLSFVCVNSGILCYVCVCMDQYRQTDMHTYAGLCVCVLTCGLLCIRKVSGAKVAADLVPKSEPQSNGLGGACVCLCLSVGVVCVFYVCVSTETFCAYVR